jgi:hypothetical protein
MAIGFPVKDDYVTGDVLTAANMNDLSGSVNLLESAQYAAGKNKIINGAFDIWQRGTTFTDMTSASFAADRWRVNTSDGLIDVSRSTFTLGAAPLNGLDGKFFATVSPTATDTDPRFTQPIERVETFAGQTVTVSFYAKSTITTDAIRFVRLRQNFGTGGSPSLRVDTDSSAITLTSSWARYTATITLPSITGKTLGTAGNDCLEVSICLKASTAQTLDIWGVQIEAGSVATAFQTATGTIQGELAACQRYYYRAGAADTNAYGGLSNAAFAQSTTVAISAVALPVQMRIAPTSVDFANVAFRQTNGAANGMTAITIDSGQTSATVVSIYGTVSSMTINLPGFLMKNNNSAGFLGFSAEL